MWLFWDIERWIVEEWPALHLGILLVSKTAATYERILIRLLPEPMRFRLWLILCHMHFLVRTQCSTNANEDASFICKLYKAFL